MDIGSKFEAVTRLAMNYPVMTSLIGLCSPQKAAARLGVNTTVLRTGSRIIKHTLY